MSSLQHPIRPLLTKGNVEEGTFRRELLPPSGAWNDAIFLGLLKHE
jgi:hypothetical protein